MWTPRTWILSTLSRQPGGCVGRLFSVLLFAAWLLLSGVSTADRHLLVWLGTSFPAGCLSWLNPQWDFNTGLPVMEHQLLLCWFKVVMLNDDIHNLCNDPKNKPPPYQICDDATCVDFWRSDGGFYPLRSDGSNQLGVASDASFISGRWRLCGRFVPLCLCWEDWPESVTGNTGKEREGWSEVIVARMTEPETFFVPLLSVPQRKLRTCLLLWHGSLFLSRVGPVFRRSLLHMRRLVPRFCVMISALAAARPWMSEAALKSVFMEGPVLSEGRTKVK